MKNITYISILVAISLYTFVGLTMNPGYCESRRRCGKSCQKMYNKLENMRKIAACLSSDNSYLKEDLLESINEAQDWLLRKTNLTPIKPVYDEDCRKIELWQM